MCCGGTVATTCARLPSARPIASASVRVLCAVLACTLDHVFGFAFGWPVLPDVKPIATACSPSTSGTSMSPGEWPRGIGHAEERQGRGCAFDDSRHVFPSPSQWDPSASTHHGPKCASDRRLTCARYP